MATVIGLRRRASEQTYATTRLHQPVIHSAFWRLGRIIFGGRSILIHQYSLTGAIEIIELATFRRPPKCDAYDECQQHAEGNKEDEDFHVQVAAQSTRPRRIRRSEFATTAIELSAMPIAASAGEIFPIIAMGMAMRL